MRKYFIKLYYGILFILGACSAPGGITDVSPTNTEVSAPANADRGIWIVGHEWAERMNVSTPDFPIVRWFSGECLEYSFRPGIHCPMGTTIEGEIHLLAADTLADTYLAHEMLHWTLGQVTGDSDESHSSPYWKHVSEVGIKLVGL